jgi:hypothetical protein
MYLSGVPSLWTGHNSSSDPGQMCDIRIIASIFDHCAADPVFIPPATMDGYAHTFAVGQRDFHLGRDRLTSEGQGCGFGSGSCGRSCGEAGSQGFFSGWSIHA